MAPTVTNTAHEEHVVLIVHGFNSHSAAPRGWERGCRPERAVTRVTLVQESSGSSVGGRFADDGTLFTSRSYSRSMSGLESMKSAVARLQAIGTL